MQFTFAIFAFAASVLAQQEVGGGVDGNLGPFQGTAGGALNGPTGFIEGCIGGSAPGFAKTECFPVETAPAPTATKTEPYAGKAAGTLGPASGFLDSNGFCGGAAVGKDGFTTCLVPGATPAA